MKRCAAAAYLPGRILPVALRESRGPCRRESAHRRVDSGDPPGEPGQGIPPYSGRFGQVLSCTGQRQAGAAHLPQPGDSVCSEVRAPRLHTVGSRPQESGGECTEPQVLCRPPQREVAHRCDGVPLLHGPHHAQALSERHPGLVRPEDCFLRHPGYQ